MVATMSTARREARRSILIGVGTLQTAFVQLRWWSSTQWSVALAAFLLMFIVLGEVGQTLPPASSNRVYPIEWWNYLTLVADSALMALIAASFVTPGAKRLASAGGGGFASAVAAIVMACPVCSPLAIPLLGAGGALAFLRGDRGWIALASIVVLAAAAVLRLQATASCPVPVKGTHTSAQAAP
jgi:hypothetical protein